MRRDVHDKNVAALKSIKEDGTLELFVVLRDYIQHEDGLIHQRTTWFLMLNSFLFTAVALLTGVDPQKSTFSGQQIAAIAMIISAVGAITSIISWISVSAAYNSIKAIKDLWIDKYEPESQDLGGTYMASDSRHEPLPRFDPTRLLPYIKGGGPNSNNALKGRYVAYILFVGVFAAWALIFLLANDAILAQST